MLKNYFIVALRNIRRNKVHSSVTIGGLALGLAASFMLLLFVQDELSYDAYHGQYTQIVRVIDQHHSGDQATRSFGHTIPPLGPALVEEMPGVVNSARLLQFGRATVRTETAWFYEGDHFFADPSIFDIFDFAFLSGDRQTALEAPGSIVMTQSTADKYFGSIDPIGATIDFGRFGEFQVTGLVADPPKNSHLNFSMFISMSTVMQNPNIAEYMKSWEGENFVTYLLLGENASLPAITAQLQEISAKHRGPDAWADRSFFLQPLSDVHFGSAYIESDVNRSKGNMLYVYMLTIIALFVIAVAIINYVNLNTARYLNRAKEIGVRKTVGANRGHLIAQFITETMLYTLIAGIIAIGLIELLLPTYNGFTGKQMSIDLSSAGTLLKMIGTIVTVGLVTGLYPALYHSRHSTMGSLKPLTGSAHNGLRKGLVLAQFTMCIILVASTLVVSNQLDYVSSKWLGFDQSRLITVDINSGITRSSFREMKAQFGEWASVTDVSVSSRVPGDWKTITQIEVVAESDATSESIQMSFLGVDAQFIDTYKVKLTEGRTFESGRVADSTTVLLSQAAVRSLGWDNPIGRTIQVPKREFTATVIGTFEDFHFRSLHEQVGPMVLGNWNNPIQSIDYFTMRVTGTELPATLAHLADVHARFDTDTPVEINFLDDRLTRFYEMDAQAGTLFQIGAGLALVLALLGMFGLITYSAERRTKEIGIRKVLGASVSSIVNMLSGEFMKIVLLANIIAIPVTWFVMSLWLENFAYRTEMGLPVFVIAGLMAGGVAFVTVGTQSLRAATANPVDSLRYE